MKVPVSLLLACLILVPLMPAGAADVRPEEIEKLVREGQVDLLMSRLGGGRTTDDKHALAQAAANKARRARAGDDRARAFKDADSRYREWITLLEKPAKGGAATDVVRLAAARTEYGGMILSGQAAGDLDEYEISMGQRGDKKALREWLEAARKQYEQAQKSLTPIADDMNTHEEELLAAGLYDTLNQTQLDLKLNGGWAEYYLGVLEEQDAQARAAHFAAAEKLFQELVDSGQTGQMRYLCYLALAMTQRERGRMDEAEKTFRYALGEDTEPGVECQVRYELARTQLRASKFDEARATLKPLVEKDLKNLPPEYRTARFYLNLAQLWDANSYLLEAESVQHEARESAAYTAILQKADHLRETGLGRLRSLANQGGPWPSLVQLYVAASVDLRTPTRQLSALELVYTAGALIDAKRYQEARDRLVEATQRENVPADVAAQAYFDLGRCTFQQQDHRAAAEAFEKVVRDYASWERAPQAATFAYQLWGKVAERSKRPEDYGRLADVLRLLLERFADHPNRDEAAWLLPVALQLAGRYDEAAAQFAKVPESSRHREESLYRQAQCGRRAVEAARATLSAEELRTRGQQAADALLAYAAGAQQRAPQAIDQAAVQKWAAEARVSGAELLATQDVAAYEAALKAVEPFEQQPPESELLGRVLAVRIRAYRGLRDFEQASQILSRYLQAAPAEQVGPTLAALAKGMQEEVERLVAAGQADEARKLAADSVGTFEELEKWVRADAGRAKNLEFVLSGRAQMHYLAGQYDAAAQIVTDLLTQNPRNGNTQHLNALVLGARLGPDSPADQVRAAQDAWAKLLVDPAIRQRAPERYWEARYNYLSLSLRLGQAAEVADAIWQESRWYPDLGGDPWQTRLTELYQKAGGTRGLAPETQPAEPGTSPETQPAGTASETQPAAPSETQPVVPLETRP